MIPIDAGRSGIRYITVDFARLPFGEGIMEQKDKLSGDRGFTLLELLITVVILGILAAIALPQLLNQVAKGRQSDAISSLGTINRAQQVYRYENAIFGTIGNGTNGTLPVKVESRYYIYSDVGSPTSLAAAHYADAIARYDDDIKDYASSVGMTSAGVFSGIICEALAARLISGEVSSTNGTTCGNGTIRVD